MHDWIARNWPVLVFAAITVPWSLPAVYAHLRWQIEAGRRLRRQQRKAGHVTVTPRARW